eukprot:c11418_g1_i1 orf=94-306(+)
MVPFSSVQDGWSSTSCHLIGAAIVWFQSRQDIYLKHGSLFKCPRWVEFHKLPPYWCCHRMVSKQTRYLSK